MLEYIVVFAIVSLAVLYVGKVLWRETKSNGCEGCSYAARCKRNTTLIQIKPLDKNKLW